MAKPKNQLVLWLTRAARRSSVLGLVLILVFVVGFSFGSPFQWLSYGSSCGSCDCECSSETLLPVPIGLDCGEQDPDMREEMEKDRVTLLAEELELVKSVEADESKHTKSLLKSYDATSVAYKNEYQKCMIKIKTSEEARERAEAELSEELKGTAVWEDRARELGWVEDEEVVTSHE